MTETIFDQHTEQDIAAMAGRRQHSREDTMVWVKYWNALLNGQGFYLAYRRGEQDHNKFVEVLNDAQHLKKLVLMRLKVYQPGAERIDAANSGFVHSAEALVKALKSPLFEASTPASDIFNQFGSCEIAWAAGVKGIDHELACELFLDLWWANERGISFETANDEGGIVDRYSQFIGLFEEGPTWHPGRHLESYMSDLLTRLGLLAD